jgi:hypothetical protein
MRGPHDLGLPGRTPDTGGQREIEIERGKGGSGAAWAREYVPLEDILWIDYGLSMHLLANRCKVVGGMIEQPQYESLSEPLGYVAASDTKRGRFIPLVEYLQNSGGL